MSRSIITRLSLDTPDLAGIDKVRFSVLSDKKIQLSYYINVKSKGVLVDRFKAKFRYVKECSFTMMDNKKIDVGEFKLIYPNEKFIRNLSMMYGIKKNKIKFNFIEKSSYKKQHKIFIDENLFLLDNILSEIVLSDDKWHRDMVIKKIING